MEANKTMGEETEKEVIKDTTKKEEKIKKIKISLLINVMYKEGLKEKGETLTIDESEMKDFDESWYKVL